MKLIKQTRLVIIFSLKETKKKDITELKMSPLNEINKENIIEVLMAQLKEINKNRHE